MTRRSLFRTSLGLVAAGAIARPFIAKGQVMPTTVTSDTWGRFPRNVVYYTMAELQRDMAHLRFLKDHIKQIETTREKEIKKAPDKPTNSKVLHLRSVRSIGVETSDMLVHEVFWRELRDQRAVACYVGLTGSPDESGARRREKGVSKAGNARVRRGMIQLAWRFLKHQKHSGLTQWFEARVAAGKGRKTMIVALARKLLIALWRFVTLGEVPEGVVLRPAS